MNGLPLSEYIDRLRCNRDIGNFVFLDPGKFHVHHLDENPHNNSLSNLEILPAAEHIRQHGRAEGWKHVTAFTTPDQVRSILYYGPEMTYDLMVEEEPHNFLANGIVVHNSGRGQWGSCVPMAK